MNKLPILLLAALFCACQTSQVTIEGRFVGNDAKTIYLEQSNIATPAIIDSAALDEQGNYRLQIAEAPRTPSLYTLICNGERIPLFLEAGDRVKVSATGSVISNYTVEGSDESELVRTFYQPFIAGAQNLERIAVASADRSLSEAERKTLVEQYATEYYALRRAQLEFLVEQKGSLAAVYAIYQRLRGDQHLFDGESDVVYYREVAEALAERYPESPYLIRLRGDIESMEAATRLSSQIIEATFPDLELPNIYGKKVTLSSLKGKVILLDFWSAELGNSNVLNAELKELYAKYHNAATPLEVYQVAIDTSKPLWINTVQQQQLPWISVSDLRGRASTALGTYNVQQLPTNFLIDKNGTILARNLRGEALERKLSELTR